MLRLSCVLLFALCALPCHSLVSAASNSLRSSRSVDAQHTLRRLQHQLQQLEWKLDAELEGEPMELPAAGQQEDEESQSSFSSSSDSDSASVDSAEVRLPFKIPHFSFGNFFPTTVPSLDVSAYLGDWFEMYADAIVNDTFQRNSYCAMAHYNLLPNGKVGVYNTQNVASATGKFGSITGTGTTTSAPGQLVVRLAGVPIAADYWIVALGPIVNGQYEWAIVTDRLKATLFILARDVATFRSQYQSTVLDQAKTLGFTHFYNKPQPIVQDGCTYPTQENVNAVFAQLTAANQK